MKKGNTILFALSAGFLFIGIHQHMNYGFINAYWLYMLSIGLLLWYSLKKGPVNKNTK